MKISKILNVLKAVLKTKEYIIEDDIIYKILEALFLLIGNVNL